MSKTLLFSLLFVSVMLVYPVQALVVLPDNFNVSISHNDTYQSHFRVIPTNATNQTNYTSDISIHYSSPIEIILEDTELSLSTWKDINYTITVPECFPSGEYLSLISVDGENESKWVRLNITILEHRNFTIEQIGGTNKSLGDFGYINIVITNNGNSHLVMTKSLETDNTTILTLMEQQIVLPPCSVILLPIQYNIPHNISPGIYQYNLTLESEDLAQKTNIQINVSDNEFPEIHEVEFESEEKAGQNFSITAEITDNLNISQVWAVLDNETFIFSKNNSYYERVFNFKRIGDLNMTLYANDTSNNIANESIEIILEPLKNYEFHDITYHEYRKGFLLEQTIFEAGSEVPFNVTLAHLSFQGAGNATGSQEIWVDVDGKRYDLEMNKTYEFITDSLDFDFRGNADGYYEVKINFTFPDWVGSEYTYEFATEVGHLVISDSYKSKIGNALLDCKSNYTGSTDDASWVCNTIYPITTSLDSLGRFMTESEYQSIQDARDSAISEKQKDVDMANVSASWGWGLFIVFLICLIPIYIFKIRGIRLKLR